MAKPMHVKAYLYRGSVLIHHVNECVGFVNLDPKIKELTTNARNLSIPNRFCDVKVPTC